MVLLRALPGGLVLLTACGTVGSLPPRVSHPLVLELAPGTQLQLRCAASDELPWRAAEPLWREALQQSARFAVAPPAAKHALAQSLELTVDLEHGELRAALLQGEHRMALASVALTTSLPKAIDQLALSTREALGEIDCRSVPVAEALTANETAVCDLADADSLRRDGAIAPAERLGLALRRVDGGSPAVLHGLAVCALLQGRAQQAEQLAQEALGYQHRLTPTRQHQLARALLLARQRDAELLQLAKVFRRERPFDAEGLLSAGIANNFLGEFAAARQALQQATQQLQGDALAWYHLGWAELAQHEPALAARHFAMAAPRLPAATCTVPLAIALHEAGQTAALTQHLAQLGDELARDGQDAWHDVARMQVAQALLAGDAQQAKALLYADLRWLAAHPHVLHQRAAELAEAGMVFVELGGAAALSELLDSMQRSQPPAGVADALAFLSGLVQVRLTGQRATAAERSLARGGDSVFSLLLAADAHAAAGELEQRYQATARAARLAHSPLVKRKLADCLRLMGRSDEATTLLTTLHDELTTIALRRRPQHPLLAPELAYAVRKAPE